MPGESWQDALTISCINSKYHEKVNSSSSKGGSCIMKKKKSFLTPDTIMAVTESIQNILLLSKKAHPFLYISILNK